MKTSAAAAQVFLSLL